MNKISLLCGWVVPGLAFHLVTESSKPFGRFSPKGLLPEPRGPCYHWVANEMVTGIIIAFPATAVLAVILLLLGHAFSQRRGITAKARLVRVALEVAGLNIALLSLMTGTSRLSPPWDDIFGTPLLLFCILGVPCWAAIRLIPQGIEGSATAIPAYARFAEVFTVVTCACLTWGLVVFPPLLRSGLSSFAAGLPKGMMALVGSLTLVETAEFLFYRSLVELISFVRNRHYNVDQLPVGTTRLVWSYRILTALLVLVLGLWLVSIETFRSQSARPGTAFVPPLFTKPIPGLDLKISPSQAIDRSTESMIAASVPPLFCLLLAWFVARQRIPHAAALLFCTACLLHCLWGLDVLPNTGGIAIWIAHMLAWLFVAPVHLDLAVVFPSSHQTLTPDLRKTWARLRPGLYGMFMIVAPGWVYLGITPAADAYSQMQHSVYWVPVVLLSGFAGLLAFPLSCVLGVYILVQTARGFQALSERAVPVAADTGCTWQDLILGSQRDRRPYIDSILRQIRLVRLGAICSAVLFMFWLITVVPIIVQGFGIAADWLVRTVLTLFFFFVALAIVQHRLWNIPQIMVVASVWPFAVFILPMLYKWSKSLLEHTAVAVFGGLPVVLITVVVTALSLNHLTPLVYRAFFKKKWHWQRNLDKVGLTLGQGEFTSIGHGLDRACPEGVCAAWLLESTNRLTNGPYGLTAIHHSTGCVGVCCNAPRSFPS